MIENKVKVEKKNEKTDVDTVINQLVSKAQKALKIMDSFDQKKVDHITHAMVMAGQDKHMELATMAYEETGRGVAEDKAIKNMYATEEIWHSIRTTKQLV